MPKLPEFAELVASVAPPDALVAEAVRQAIAVKPSIDDPGAAKVLLIGAADVAAWEGAIRWLQTALNDAITMAEMVGDPTGDADAWASDVREAFAPATDAIGALADFAPRDPDAPTVEQIIAGTALTHPSTRGDALRQLRATWLHYLAHKDREARAKPGAWLSALGIAAPQIEQVVQEARERAPATEPEAPPAPPALPATPPPPPPPPPTGPLPDEAPEEPKAVAAEHPPPKRGAPRKSDLPGARAGMPDFATIAQAINWLREARWDEKATSEALRTSRSTLSNWATNKSRARLTVQQASFLRSECLRIAADLGAAEQVFADIITAGGFGT